MMVLMPEHRLICPISKNSSPDAHCVREGQGIYTVDLYLKVRLACDGGMSQREAARHFGISRDTVRKMLAYSVPPGYRRQAPVRRPKLDAFTAIIDRWLDR